MALLSLVFFLVCAILFILHAIQLQVLSAIPSKYYRHTHYVHYSILLLLTLIDCYILYPPSEQSIGSMTFWLAYGKHHVYSLKFFFGYLWA